MTEPPWLTADDAAARLGISRASLYAYVSRGRVRSQKMAGGSRRRGYAREDIERLRRRAEGRRDPDAAAAHALQWGVPVLESAITLIDGSRFYYRGYDAVELARTRSVDEVAALIWTGRLDPGGLRAARTLLRKATPPLRMPPSGSFVSRAQRALAAVSANDPAAFDLRPEHVAAAGGRILATVVAAATAAPPGVRMSGSIDVTLGRAWKLDDRDIGIVRAALILCADHELNVSSFTARCVASAGSSPYAVVIAGLAALEGPRHGGASARTEAMLESVRKSRDLAGAIQARLRRGEPIEGFGHPLYPDGDPRAKALFERLRAAYAKSPELAFVLAFERAASAAGRGHPNLDFALTAVSRVLRLPPGSPIVLFATGRTIGWIGHAIEQYATGQLIRPRAKYVGERPLSAGRAENVL
jgi:citrate synthase